MWVTRQPSPTGLLLGHMDSPSFTQGIQPLVLKPHLCIKAPRSLLGSTVHTLLIQKPFPPGCSMPGPSLSTGTPVNVRPILRELTFSWDRNVGLWGPIKVNSKHKRKGCWHHPKLRVKRKRCELKDVMPFILNGMNAECFQLQLEKPTPPRQTAAHAAANVRWKQHGWQLGSWLRLT